MLLFTCVELIARVSSVVAGLRKFVSRCDEFCQPIEPFITLEEINDTLDVAERLGVIGFVAPIKPLFIILLNSSHKVRDSEYGISGDGSRTGTIMLYHPRNTDVHDRVFIFALELGHALHLALTGDIRVLPEGFDGFNESMGVQERARKIPDNVKSELFADAAAIAILGAGSGLEEHLPVGIQLEFTPYFARYIETEINHSRF